MKPVAPSFAEPEDQTSGMKLPPALSQHSNAEAIRQRAANVGDEANPHFTTRMDANDVTLEKMRGEYYVRVFTHTNKFMARKQVLPYLGESLNPDARHVTGPGQPRLQMDKAEPVVNEDGELEYDDQYDGFERNDVVIFSLVRHNRYEAVEALIGHDLSVAKSEDANGNSLLHTACQNNNRRIAKLLIGSGVDVNKQNKAGNTALHHCTSFGFLALGDFLIAQGADETICNKAGRAATEGGGPEGDNDPATGQQQLQSER
jgi:hypothetical protein